MRQWIPSFTLLAALAGVPAVTVAQVAAPPPAPRAAAVPIKVVNAPAKAERVTFLGAATSRATPGLREQLKLVKGTGLVVDSVEPKSPAEAAGLQQHDVIEKLNDQLLVNGQQLSALIRGMKEDDDVTLSVIRQGEHKTLKVKLATKETTDGNVWFETLQPGMPGRAGWSVGMAGQPQTLALVGPPTMMVGGAPVRLQGNVMVRNLDGKQSTEWSDGQYRIALDKDGDKRPNVTIHDATGARIFQGALPADDSPLFKEHPELRDKLKKALDAATTTPMHLLFRTANIADMAGGGRGKVVRWQDDHHILILRIVEKKPVYLLALSKKDGRTLYDGPVVTDDQRKSVPNEVSESFELLVTKPDLATEFGADGK
jgi:hypothetical protein